MCRVRCLYGAERSVHERKKSILAPKYEKDDCMKVVRAKPPMNTSVTNWMMMTRTDSIGQLINVL